MNLSTSNILQELARLEKEYLLPIVSYRYALRAALLFFIVTLFTGCSLFKGEPEKYKIIAAKPVVKTKIVTKTVKRSCPDLPSITKDASPAELTKHHRVVILMYKRCAG